MIDIMNSIAAFSSTPKLLNQPTQPQSQTSTFASQMIDVVKQAETAAMGSMQGQVPMQDVVMKIMEAERTFSTAIAIRDKAVSAYLEISRMQI